MLKIIRYVVRFIPVLIMIAVTFFSVFSASEARLEEEIKLQISRINELEQLYSQGEIKSVDEASFFEGDLQAELASGIKFNELSFIATHNSYQTESIDETDKMVWYSHLFKNFPQFVVIYTVKGFAVVNGAEVDVFLEFPCYLYNAADVGHLSSDSSASSVEA